MSRARVILVVCGCAAGVWGLQLLLRTLSLDALVHLPIWLGGAVLVDDFFLIPLIVAVGALLTRRLTGSALQPVRVTVLYVGLTTLIALPLLLRQGKGPNPTVLPRNYLLDWLLLEATVIVVGAVVLGLRLRHSHGSAGLPFRRGPRS